MNPPNLFVVGKPKSGTTALYYLLAQHPEIYMSPIKESCFFCKDTIEEIEAHHKGKVFMYRTKTDYLSLFATAENEKVVGECSPQYIYSRVAAQEIFNFNPNAKIIIILREPVSFLYSLHSQLITTTTETVVDFEMALSLENQRKLGMNIPRITDWPSALFYSERMKYYEQIIRYYNLFDKSQIKVVIYEDFKENNPAVYKDILGFLKVDVDFSPKYVQVNLNRKPRFVKLHFWVRRWAYREPFLKKILQRCPVFYEKTKRIVKKNILLKTEPRKPLEPTLRKKLMTKYKPEVIKISDFLGMDLVKRWGYDEVC